MLTIGQIFPMLPFHLHMCILCRHMLYFVPLLRPGQLEKCNLICRVIRQEMRETKLILTTYFRQHSIIVLR